MRRAEFEISRLLKDETVVVADAVRSQPNLRTLVREYHKYLLGLAGGLIGV
jgi:hypothetical protein